MPVSKNKKIKKDSTKKIPKRKAKSTKKSPAKKTIRKKAEKKTSKKVEADIKKAVDKLPGLIVEQIKFEQPFVEKQYAPIKKEFTDSRNHSKRDNGKRKLLWLFVLAITTIIFTMWIWNVTVFFKDTNRLRKTEAGLFDSAKETYNEIISQDIENDMKTELEKEEPLVSDEDLKESLKASLINLFSNNQAVLETTTTTNTSTNNTTTIKTNTTTIE